jgi:hypothetical protein
MADMCDLDARRSLAIMSEIAEFFRGRCVLVTGASGFMGKVLVEKLLYSCSDLRAIYILVRRKRGKTPEARTEELLKLPVSKLPWCQAFRSTDRSGLSNSYKHIPVI